MAVQKQEVHTSTGAAPSAPRADTSYTQDQTYIPPVESAPGRLGLINLMNRFNTGTGVTPEIEAYLKTIITQVKLVVPRVELVQLAEPVATQAFVVTGHDSQRYAYLILFPDAIGARLAQNMPMSRYITRAHAALLQQFPNCHMVSAVLIGNQDLGRARQMSTDIIGAFLPLVSADVANKNASILTAAGEFAIDFNIEAARAFENKRSPHEVRPAADLGFTIALRDNRSRYTGSSYQDLSEAPDALMAVTAKVEINGPQRDMATNVMRYVPMVRITSITSDLPLIGSVLLGLVIAADYFITKRRWQMAFNRFERGAPNLGNLFPNPENTKKGEFYTVSNQMELDNLITNQFTQPLLVLDVMEGRSRIAGLSAFLDQEHGRETLLQSAARFFVTESVPNMNVVSAMIPRFEGYYGDAAGRLLDTRSITYLEQVAKQGVLDHNTMQVLLGQDTNPIRRAEVIAALTQNFVSYNEVYLAALNGQFMSWISQAVTRAGMRIIDPMGLSGFVQMPTTFLSATDYSNFQSVAAMQTGGYNARPGMLYG